MALVGRMQGCAFCEKAARAAKCGAAAVLVINNDEAHPDATITMVGTDNGSELECPIPVMMVSHATGQRLLSAARGGESVQTLRFAARCG